MGKTSTCLGKERSENDKVEERKEKKGNSQPYGPLEESAIQEGYIE
jgi:hypothetical protein